MSNTTDKAETVEEATVADTTAEAETATGKSKTTARRRSSRGRKTAGKNTGQQQASQSENKDKEEAVSSVSEQDKAVAEQVAPEQAPLDDEVVQRIGHVIKMLRESMRELGLDKEIEKAAKAIPDARDRLSYIGNMTEQAAERALNAVDRAQPVQDEMAATAQKLDQRWSEWFENPVELSEARTLVEETRSYLRDVPEKTSATSKELLEIMMAQDFQDLTGQVIKKMMDVIHSLEFQLLQVVLDNVPDDDNREELQKRAAELKAAEEQRGSAFLNGPQIDPEGVDVVSNQDQVDDLLADLGF